MSDKEIVAGIIKKDERTVRYFVELYRDIIYRTCLAYLQNEEDAADLTQEIIIRIVKSINKFKGLSKLSTWVMRIAINHSLNAIRSRKNQPDLKPIDTAIERNKQDGNSAGYAYEQQQLRDALKNALNALPENQSKVFVLKKYHDMSYKEIAGITGLSESAIESLIVRAKQGLQKKLQHFYNENYR